VNACRPFLLLGAIGLTACSFERYEGGFETSDLQARVSTPEGKPAVGARVWLVRDEGNTTPGSVLDSTRTDSTGLAKFSVSKSVDRSRLGLDGQLDDWMGISTSALRRSDSTRLALAPTESVSIGASSSGELARLFVPGSHFVSKAAGSQRSVLALPRGNWTIAKSLSTGTIYFASVQVDSVAVPLDTLPVDSTARPALPLGPNILLDSFLVDSIPLFLDPAFPTPMLWPRETGSLGVVELLSALVGDDSGRVTLSTAPKRNGQGVDTLLTQGGAGIRAPNLPPSGCLAIQFQHGVDPVSDTALLRRFWFTDSLGSRVDVRLGDTRVQATDSILGAQGSPMITRRQFSSDTMAAFRATTWYFSWTPTAISIQADRDAFLGTARTNVPFHNLSFHLAASTKWPGTTTGFEIVGVRLYKPK
jgi:hypothetical protein